MPFRTQLEAAIAHLIGKGVIKGSADVARDLGLKSRGTVSAYMTGSTKISPNFQTLFENKYGVKLADFNLDEPNSMQEVHTPYKNGHTLPGSNDYREKYIALLEARVKDRELLKEVLARLDDISREMYLSAAMQQGWQEFWTEHIQLKKKMTLQEVKADIRNRARASLQKIEAEGMKIG